MSHKVIDLESWKRREQFLFFKDFANPTYSMTKIFDVTDFYKKHKTSKTLSVAITHALAKTINNTDEFKQRYENDQIIQWDEVSPSLTVTNKFETFSFCHVPYHKDFSTFSENFNRRTQECYEVNLYDPKEPQTSDKFFMTMIPWVDFVQMTHPFLSEPADTFPRFAISKCQTNSQGRVTMAVNTQVNHLFVDGVHLGKLFNKLEKNLK